MGSDDRKSGDADIEFRPDGWERFEAAVRAAAKSGPKHRLAPSSKLPRTHSKKTPIRHAK